MITRRVVTTQGRVGVGIQMGKMKQRILEGLKISVLMLSKRQTAEMTAGEQIGP